MIWLTFYTIECYKTISQKRSIIYHVNNEFEFYQKLINIMLMYFMNKPHICKVEVWFLACCIYTNCRVVCEIENIPFKLYSPLSNSEQLLEKNKQTHGKWCDGNGPKFLVATNQEQCFLDVLIHERGSYTTKYKFGGGHVEEHNWETPKESGVDVDLTLYFLLSFSFLLVQCPSPLSFPKDHISKPWYIMGNVILYFLHHAMLFINSSPFTIESKIK